MTISKENQLQLMSAQTYVSISKLYFPKLKFGKISKRIINLLVMRIMSREDIYDSIESSFKINKEYTRHFVWNLKLKGLIIENQNKLKLTIFGKFAFLMCKYRINFIQLCLLLEAFCCQHRMIKKGCNEGFYAISYFTDKVEDIFTYEYVAWNVSHMSKKGLIYRHHKGTISVMPDIFNELIDYYEIVESFHNWFIETWRKKRQLILQDPFILSRQQKNFVLIQKALF